MCPCDLTFHITTLARARDQRGGRGRHMPGWPALLQVPSSRTLPHPLQSRDKQKWLPPDAPVTWSPVFYLTLQRGLFPGCALSLSWVAAWEASPERGSLTLPSSHRSPLPPALSVTECREPRLRELDLYTPLCPGQAL